MKYLVSVAQLDVIRSYRCAFLLHMTIARVCEILVDERGVACAQSTFLIRLTFVFLDAKSLCMSNG